MQVILATTFLNAKQRKGMANSRSIWRLKEIDAWGVYNVWVVLALDSLMYGFRGYGGSATSQPPVTVSVSVSVSASFLSRDTASRSQCLVADEAGEVGEAEENLRCVAFR